MLLGRLNRGGVCRSWQVHDSDDSGTYIGLDVEALEDASAAIVLDSEHSKSWYKIPPPR